MDHGFTTKQWSMVVVVRRSLAITLYYRKNVIWNDLKSNHKISNQIQIKSHVFQIKLLFFKSNHYVWFNHDLNQIMIWICPSLVNNIASYAKMSEYIGHVPMRIGQKEESLCFKACNCINIDLHEIWQQSRTLYCPLEIAIYMNQFSKLKSRRGVVFHYAADVIESKQASRMNSEIFTKLHVRVSGCR